MESGNIPRNETEWDILLEIEQELNKWIHEQKKPGSSSHFFPTEEWIIWQQKVSYKKPLFCKALAACY